MKLTDWLNRYPVRSVSGSRDIAISRIADDSREVIPGTLFVARSRQEKHIVEALHRGAVAVVTDTEMPLPVETTRIHVTDVQDALSHLAYFLHGPPDLRLIAVTGTNGKTTTTWIIRAMLQAAGRISGLIGTIEYDLVASRFRPTHTTPGPLCLAAHFKEMRRCGATDAVMEVSSHALDQGRVRGLRFHTAIFTNLTQDHLDYHPTMTAYFNAKQRLFAQSERTIVNIDDPWGQRIPSPDLTFGITRPEAIVRPVHLLKDAMGLAMTVATPEGLLNVSSFLSGQHNAYNILAAIAAGIALGLPQSAIVEGVSRVVQVPGRMEQIGSAEDILVIVDYAHTEAALERLLETVASFSPNRILVVFGCGGDRDRAKRPLMGQAAARLSDWVILTSDNPRSEPPLSIIEDIRAGIDAMTSAKMSGYEVIPDRRKAITHAIEKAEVGDIVVIAGKGHETVQVVGATPLPFDDRQVAREVLAARDCNAGRAPLVVGRDVGTG